MSSPASSGKTIVLGVTASISAYRACDLISEFRSRGHAVRVVMTRDAHHFVTPLALQSFAGSEVVDDFFSVPGRLKPVHIELARAASAIVIAPASADVLAKISHGLADDVLTCTVLATQAPVIAAPAMNEVMWKNPFTQENLERLKKHGMTIVPPIEGHLVCMERGMGHLAELSSIIAAVESRLTDR